MLTLLDIELEGLPPSVNRMYGQKGNHSYKRTDAREWQEYAERELREEWGDKPSMKSPLELSLEYTTRDHRKWDMDNRIKAVQDTLQYAAVIADDRLIERLHVMRKYGERNATRIILRVIEEDEDE